MKLHGAAQGTASLVAEVIVGAIADRLTLPVPERRIITLAPGTPRDDRNDELGDLLDASSGENLGFQFLPAARPLRAGDLSRITRDFASQVWWLDWLVLNPDRSPRNPNILTDGSRFWLIDHGAALPFQHDWSAVREASPHRPPLGLPHLFDGLATDVNAWDPLLTSQLTREVLEACVDEVPESFLAPLLPEDATAERVHRRRAAYTAYLWKRLHGPRDFTSRSGPARARPG